MDLQVGTNVIGSYRRLAYTPWHALAEFVDNSTQSFFDNKDLLCEIKSSSIARPLRVTIEYDAETELLRITDNAMGMNYSDLEHALHLAEPPANITGRSRYGLGLKTAACWFGNLWTVKTKKYGDAVGHRVVVDVEKVARGEIGLPYTEIVDLDAEQHFTEIEIFQHNRKLKGRTLGKISQFLSSMYRQDLRSEILTLKWREQELEWIELDDRILRNVEGDPYKKDFEFFVTGERASEQSRVSGWVGVLRVGSRSSAGFSILHANRVIRGWPDSWRPAMVFGQEQGSNDLINQRLVGEIHLDDFEVSHTKDDILWLGDQEDQVEAKLFEVSKDYRETARAYRKGVSVDQRGPSPVETASAVSALRMELETPELRDIVSADPMLPEIIVKNVVEGVLSSVVETERAATYQAKLNGVAIRGYVQADQSPNDPYVAIDSTQADAIVVIVNAAHPHWSELRGSHGVLNYLRHCTYDAIAEWQARNKESRLDPDTIKILKDRLLRLVMEIERHSLDEVSDGLAEDEA